MAPTQIFIPGLSYWLAKNKKKENHRMNIYKLFGYSILLSFITIQSAENNNCILIDTISNCREIGWVLDGTILVNAHDNNIPAIYGIKTNNNNQTEVLCKFSNQKNALE